MQHFIAIGEFKLDVKSGDTTLLSATSARTPNTELRFKVTVLFVLLKIVIGKSSSFKDITERMSNDG